MLSWERRNLQEERFADVILDVALDMLVNGMMSNEEWKQWEDVFINQFKMEGFRPQKFSINGVSMRIIDGGIDGQQQPS